MKSKLMVLLVGSVAAMPAAAGVNDLAWMTGSWAGPAGPEVTLEESWTAPADGSIAAVVRMRGSGSTSMLELIVIEEDGDDLVLHLQQWDPGFTPRAAGAQKMVMASMGDRTVTFEGVDGAGFSSLTYGRPADDTFTLNVKTAEGGEFALELKAL